VPKLGEQHGAKSVVHIALEVILISAGVFLGLAGEQWRESARHRELSHEAMQRFRTEIVENRKAVAAVSDYHVTLQKALDTEFRKPSAKRSGGEHPISRHPPRDLRSRGLGSRPGHAIAVVHRLGLGAVAFEHL
jgi:hypothetical protein